MEESIHRPRTMQYQMSKMWYAVFIKSLEWLANHRSYVCNCGAAMDALQVHTEAEIESLNKAIEKAKDK